MPNRSLFCLGVHLYQPPTQSAEMRDEIYRTSYEPLVSYMERYPFIKMSMNIALSLGEHLPREYLARLRALYKNGQLEMVNTIAFHPLAPITPRELLVKQIRMNEDFYRTYIIDDDPLPGIFPPEMAYKQSLARLFRELGYTWCLADDKMFVHQRRNLKEPERAPSDWIPEAYGLGVLLRSRDRSLDLAFKDVFDGRQYAKEIIRGQDGWRDALGRDGDSYLYMYLDGETFGHHRPELLEKFLLPFCDEIARSRNAGLVSLNTIYEGFEKRRAYVPRSSWSTDVGDPPYHLWDHPANEFHQLWNEFIAIAYAMAPTPLSAVLEDLFHRNFYSCSPWQYSMGNRGVARWCLPGFERIADHIPHSSEKIRLNEIIKTMDALTA